MYEKIHFTNEKSQFLPIDKYFYAKNDVSNSAAGILCSIINSKIHGLILYKYLQQNRYTWPTYLHNIMGTT